MVECLICLAAIEPQSLAVHLWWQHAALHSCWCGEDMLAAEPFWQHCEEHGGYLAHYLEFQLGVDRG
jgi:hypothetical protein